MPLHHVKELLGHANISTTDTYVNAGRVHLQESMRKVEEARKDAISATNLPQNVARPTANVATGRAGQKGKALLHWHLRLRARVAQLDRATAS